LDLLDYVQTRTATRRLITIFAGCRNEFVALFADVNGLGVARIDQNGLMRNAPTCKTTVPFAHPW